MGLELRRAGKHGEDGEERGELQWWKSVEFHPFDTNEAADKPTNIKGTIPRISRSPDPTTLNTECEFLGGFQARTGAPALEGPPYETDEGGRVPR